MFNEANISAITEGRFPNNTHLSHENIEQSYFTLSKMIRLDQ